MFVHWDDIRYSVEKDTDFKLNYCHTFLRKSKEKFAATGLQFISYQKCY